MSKVTSVGWSVLSIVIWVPILGFIWAPLGIVWLLICGFNIVTTVLDKEEDIW